MGSGGAWWSWGRGGGHSVVTSVTAALAEDSSTMALLVANAATRAWTARFFTARGSWPNVDRAKPVAILEESRLLKTEAHLLPRAQHPITLHMNVGVVHEATSVDLRRAQLPPSFLFVEPLDDAGDPREPSSGILFCDTS